MGPDRGQYDRHLDHLRAEEAANDPPPLTPERLRSLLDSIRGTDPDEQRWARYELDASQPDDLGVDDSTLDEVWAHERLATPGAPA